MPGYTPVARFTISAEQPRERERERERERAAISGGVSKRRNDKVATRMVLFVSTFRRGHAVFTVLGVYDALNYPVCNKTRGGTRMTPR